MKKLYILLIILFTGTFSGKGQELNCQVDIIPAPALQIGPVEKEVFEEMKQSIFDFMNNTRWTKDVFEIEERINCNILITITDIPSTATYKGKIQIQSSRPVHNTNYNTVLLNHVDNNFNVNYLRSTTILPSENFQYRDNLSAILTFYAYMILAYDYDSFSPNGGDQYFKNAQQLANNAKASGDEGWSAAAGKRNNRYWMVDNALQSVFSPLRDCYYRYHRLGFDIMNDDMVNGRKEVLASLKGLDKIQRSRPGSLNLQMFLTAKSQELIDLFSQSETREKNEAVSLLKRLDPTNSSKYQEILN
ncbi:MAG: DUF4835 family protein [Flavobacteriales bacterium]|nr:DUF4835 family protein [Flavobacteriales bacterium]